MRSNQGSSYQKPDYFRQSYQTSAFKSPERKRVDQTQQYTPTKFSKKPNQRLSNLKNSINKCIEELSNKKDMNREALEEVRDVNREIIESFSYQEPERIYRSSQRHAELEQAPRVRTEYAPRYDPSFEKQRDHVTLSSFHLGPVNQNQQRINDFHASQIYRPESQASNQYEIQDVRQKLKNQRMQNQGLQTYLQDMRNQNTSLYRETAQFQPQADSFLLSQNQRLREELVRMDDQQNMGAIYEEFQRLKEDNERLRRETISLLKFGRQ